MKILIIHQYYLMPGEPGGSRFNEFARLWSEAGHHVTVIAGNLGYLTGTIPAKYRGRWITREQDGQVTVWRCHVSASYSKGFLGRMWGIGLFALSATTAVLAAERPDVIIATSPPLLVPIPGWIAARKHWRRVPWIFEVRDLWPESAIAIGALGKDSLLAKGLYRLERWTYKNSDRINVLTPAFQEDILQRGLAPREKFLFIPNGADVGLFKPAPRDNSVRKEYGWEDQFVVMYTGAHGRANALHQLIDTAERLRDHSDILIVCVGDGPERNGLVEQTNQRNLQNIQFVGAQPKERMPDFINACDVGAAVLQDNPTFRTVYPNKVFDYMACEKPSLVAIDGVARKLVCDEARAGVFAEPENPDSIANVILKLKDTPKDRAKMGQRGRAWVLANATRETLATRYLTAMKELVGS